MNAFALHENSLLRQHVLKAATALGVLGGGALSAPRILAALCNPAATLREVSSLIGSEPGLTARVLRVANSAYYGVARSVSTVDRALVVLGLDAVRGIAAAACLDRTVMRAQQGASIDRAALVRHSLAAAAAAEALARIRHRSLAPDAFIAGVLHNLGVPVQALVDPDGVNAFALAMQEDPAQDASLLERQCVLVSHEHCVEVIFESWSLPPALIASAGHHHHPTLAAEPHRALAVLLHLGLRVASETGNSFPLEPAGGGRDPALLARVGLTAADLDAVALSLPERLRELQAALSDA